MKHTRLLLVSIIIIALMAFTGCTGSETPSTTNQNPTPQTNGTQQDSGTQQDPGTQASSAQFPASDKQDVMGIWTETHWGAANISLRTTDGAFKSEDKNNNGVYDPASDGSGTPWFNTTGEEGGGKALTRVDDTVKDSFACTPAEGKECMYFEWFKVKDGRDADTLMATTKLMMADSSKDWSGYQDGGVLKMSIKAKDHDTANKVPAECWVWVGAGTGYHEYRLKAEEIDDKWHEISMPVADIGNAIDPSAVDFIEIKGYDVDCWIDDIYISKNSK